MNFIDKLTKVLFEGWEELGIVDPGVEMTNSIWFKRQWGPSVLLVGYKNIPDNLYDAFPELSDIDHQKVYVVNPNDVNEMALGVTMNGDFKIETDYEEDYSRPDPNFITDVVLVYDDDIFYRQEKTGSLHDEFS